jgi:hypothetical protein
VPNWERHKPKTPREELERRIADGLKRWKERGWIPRDFGQAKRLVTTADGPTLDRAGRRRVMQAADMAIYSLANNERLDYLHAISVINATRRLAGLPNRFMVTICEGVEDAAHIASGINRELLSKLARTWLAEEKATGVRLISLPTRGEDHGESQGGGEEEGKGGGPEGVAEEAAVQGHEPELQPGEERGRTGGEGGPVPADPAGGG